MLKELKKNKMSVVATGGILFGVMGVLIIPMIAVIVKNIECIIPKTS